MKNSKRWFKKIRGLTEYRVGFASFLIWVGFALAGEFLGAKVFPFAYVQKIIFGLFGASVIMAVAWYQLEKTLPAIKDTIDPDNDNYKGLILWQKFKIGFIYLLCYAGIAALLASLC